MIEKVRTETGALRNANINNFFEASVQDLTPTELHREIRILFMPIRHDSPPADLFGSVLSVAEWTRATRFKGISDKMRFLQRRAFRRFCGAIALGDSGALSKVHFAVTKKGRPYLFELPRTWFSFSSCRHGYLAAWSSSSSIGVDIEDPEQSISAVEMASYYFAPCELDALCTAAVHERGKLFLKLWSLKEAALKSIGEGVPYGLDAFQFETTPTIRFSFAPPQYGGPNNFNAKWIQTTGCRAALVIRNR